MPARCILLPMILLACSRIYGYGQTDTPLLFLGNHSLPPMIFVENGKPAGIVVDLAEALAKRMPHPVKFEYMNWATAQQLVLEGKADALLQINPSAERRKLYDFSDPLLESEFSIFIRFDKEYIYDLRDLQGLKVGVEEKGMPIGILNQNRAISLTVIPDVVKGMQMLADGAIDAVVVDRWVGSFVLAENHIRGVRITGEAIDKSSSAIAVKKGNAALLAEINDALAAVKADGTYTKILSRWQPREVMFQTRAQYLRQKNILIAILCMFGLALIWSVFLLREIKKRRKAEQSLRESEARFRTVQESSPDGFVMLRSVRDDQGAIIDFVWTYMNSSAELIAEVAHGALLGKRLLEVRPGIRAAGLFDAYVRVVETGEPAVREQQYTRDRLTVYVRLIAIKIDDGIAISFIDLSDRKRAEEELHILNETLEGRVTERTAEAERRALQLRQLAAELTLTEQRERQRISLILHDGLQQILVAAKFHIDLLEKTRDLPKMTAELAELIDDGIETSRSLTAELSPPVLQRGGLLPALEWLVRWMRDKHGLMVSLASHGKIEQAPEEVVILLFQSVRELLFNVAKHAGIRSAQVEVLQEAGRIQIDVQDDGVGFDPIQLIGEGAESGGLGLFSIRERLGYLGGSMEIDSAPGRGSRFRLITPPISIDAAVSPIHEPSIVSIAMTSQRESTVGSERRVHVVLVDDHMVMRQGLAALLRAESDIVVIGEASDGQSAISLIRELRPDVVLMDISMPGMDGIRATQILNQELPDVRVIGLSMFQEGEQLAAMRAAGAVGCLTKSGPSTEIIDAIRKCKVPPSPNLPVEIESGR